MNKKNKQLNGKKTNYKKTNNKNKALHRKLKIHLETKRGPKIAVMVNIFCFTSDIYCFI